MAKDAERTTVRFTVACGTCAGMSGMIQTEDQKEKERRLLFDDGGIAETSLAPGKYIFVWAVKMAPLQRHRYSVKVHRIPDDGDPVELRKRTSEQTTTEGEDVGWDDFEL
jgi:hypothetical protein